VATRADFTETEWKTMQKGVTGAGMLVSISDADFTDSFGEASSVAKYLAEQQRNESVLIRDLAHVHGTGFGLTASREKAETETLDALRSAVATLRQKTPNELAAYQDGRARREREDRREAERERSDHQDQGCARRDWLSQEAGAVRLLSSS
jgi:hypothetical protein